jgi:hypothetical protein
MTARTGRTYTLLLGIAGAGALLWLATKVGPTPNWRYWTVLGLIAGGGLAFALTQRIAYGAWAEVTPLGFLIAFAVAVVCIGWIAVAGQPGASWLRDHVLSWSGDLGIRGFVESMSAYVTVMAFGFGALLASAPGAIRTPAPAAASATSPAPAAYRPPAPAVGTDGGDQTAIREREHVHA